MEDSAVCEIQDSVESDLDGGEYEGTERSPGGGRLNLSPADSGLLATVDGPKPFFGVVPSAVALTSFRAEYLVAQMISYESVELPLESSRRDPRHSLRFGKMSGHVRIPAATLRRNAPLDPPKEVSDLLETTRGPEALERSLASQHGV